MKKLLLFFLVLILASNTFANWEDIIEKEQNQEVKTINENFKIEKFTAQNDFEKFLADKLYNKVVSYCKNYYYSYPEPLYYEKVMIGGVGDVKTARLETLSE